MINHGLRWCGPEIITSDISLYVDNNVNITQYADDTQILVTGNKRNLTSLVQRMESAMCTLYQWFSQNHMKVNASKTQLIVLGTRQMLKDIPKISINVNGVKVDEIPRVKNLGVVLDRNLTYEPHVNQLVGRCTGLLIGLSHARHCLPRDVLPTLVNGLVISLVRYCITVYGNSTVHSITRIQRLLNFCARVVSGRRRREHVRDVINELNWLSAQDLAMYRALCLLKSTIAHGQPYDLSRNIAYVQSVRQRSTRQDGQLALPRISTESGRRQFAFRAARAFNDLPPATRESNVMSFRKEVREWLGSEH